MFTEPMVSVMVSKCVSREGTKQSQVMKKKRNWEIVETYEILRGELGGGKEKERKRGEKMIPEYKEKGGGQQSTVNSERRFNMGLFPGWLPGTTKTAPVTTTPRLGY